MLETDFFEKFCSNDDNVAINALVDYKNSIYALLKIATSKLSNTTYNFTTQDEEDIVEEVLYKLFDIRKQLCEKFKTGKFCKNGFKSYYYTSVKNKVIDKIRKAESEYHKKTSKREIKEAIWQLNYDAAKEQLLKQKGDLSALEFETVQIYQLKKVADHLKLLIALNLLLSIDERPYNEMKKRGYLQGQILYDEKLNKLNEFEVYNMKIADCVKRFQINKIEIEKIRDKVRKFKQFIKRKLNKKNLWKHIQIPT